MTKDQYDRAHQELARWDQRTFAPPTATAVLALGEAVLAVAEALHQFREHLEQSQESQ